MKNSLHNRILSGETTEKDAKAFRLFQVAMFLLSIALILSWISK